MPHPEKGEDDWVELYKNDNISIDLNGWKILDSTGTVKTFAEGIIISSDSAYYQVAISNRLNNSGDNIKLIDNTGKTVDEKNYETDPGINVSIGRSPDGGDYWGTLLVATANSANSPVAPSEAPKPTQTIAPAKSSTNQATKKPTVKPTSQVLTREEEKNTNLSSVAISPTKQLLVNSKVSNDNISSLTSVLGMSDKDNATISGKSENSAQNTLDVYNLFKTFIIILGTILMGLAVYLSFKKRSGKLKS